jgi:hypothetical protein
VHDALAMTEGSIVVVASPCASEPPSLGGVPEDAPEEPEDAPEEPEDAPEEPEDAPEDAPEEPEDVPAPPPGVSPALLPPLPPHATAVASAAPIADKANAETCFRTPGVLI